LKEDKFIENGDLRQYTIKGDEKMDDNLLWSLLSLLKERQDELGIIRFDAGELSCELDVSKEQIEFALDELYERKKIVYITRINKETGEEIKIVWLSEEVEGEK